MPLMLGGEVFIGAGANAAVTTALAALVAEVLPAAFLAVTTTRSVLPTSALVSW